MNIEKEIILIRELIGELIVKTDIHKTHIDNLTNGKTEESIKYLDRAIDKLENDIDILFEMVAKNEVTISYVKKGYYNYKKEKEL